MKEASGELNLTVITVVAIAAVATILWAMWPSIQGSIESSWNSGCDRGYHPVVDNVTGVKSCVAD